MFQIFKVYKDVNAEFSAGFIRFYIRQNDYDYPVFIPYQGAEESAEIVILEKDGYKTPVAVNGELLKTAKLSILEKYQFWRFLRKFKK